MIARSSSISRDQFQGVKFSALIAALIDGGVGLFIIFVISRAIAAPVQRAARMLGEIASGDGDLSRMMPVETGDEIGELASAFKRFVASLSVTVGEVHRSTQTIAMASSEIAAGNPDLSSRTEAWAASLEQTAAAMEELTSTVKQNAQNTESANPLVLSASTHALDGGAVVGKVVSTMGSITQSSQKIAEIIAMIDGIALQTNILSLNAAVEAARVSEQGRGFAVVAAVVRNLVQRSAGAAKEIKGLIDDSVAKVSTGSTLVDQAGVTMNQIVNSIKKVTDLMSEMDDATQQNAALVEPAATATQSLQDQAANLAQVVSAFKLDETHLDAVPASATTRQGMAVSKAVPSAQPLQLPSKGSKAIARPKAQNDKGADASEWEEF